MNIQRLIYYITAIFIAGTMVLITMQYITSKNVKELISGNQNLLNEFNVSNQLTELQKDMLVFDNKLKNAIITGDTANIRDYGRGLQKIENDIAALENVSSTDTIQQYIAQLNNLVHQKLQFSNAIADSFNKSGKLAAEKLFATEEGIRLSHDILAIAQKIDINRQHNLERATIDLDNSGQKAFTWGVITMVAVLCLFTVIFWFVLNRLKKQYELIGQLNESEKRIKEVMQVKENFLANMSHEIRTPMNAILGYTNILLRKNLDAETKLHVVTIQKSGENLLAIVNDILDISKIEAGMMRLEETAFNIHDLVHSIEIMFENKVRDKGLMLAVHIDKSITASVTGDAVRLSQVLINLVGNAVKFTERGVIDIKVWQQQTGEQIADTYFCITDTGIGIPPEKLHTIFDRFTQAEDSTTRKFGGTGLGLSIVKNIVALQNGSIDIESEPGTGTKICFHIPYKKALFAAGPSGAFHKKQLTPFSFPVKILVAEDNQINQHLLEHLFNEWNITGLFAGNGRMLIDLLKKENADMILMDIQMPGMDGYATTTEIRQGLHAKIPIIAMTAHALPGEKEKCQRYGMNDHIAKPIREAELYAIIQRYAKPGKENYLAEHEYEMLDLEYMKAISNGNNEYEKTVTTQFIEMLPLELHALQQAFDENNLPELKRIAHNMKTTISVMGLNTKMDEHLTAIETAAHNNHELYFHLERINAIGIKALKEAQLLQEKLAG